MDKVDYKIIGLDCQEEVSALKSVLLGKSGIDNLEFDLFSSRMSVHFDKRKIDSKKILALIKSAGFKALPWKERKKKQTFWEKNSRLILTIACEAFLIAGMVGHYMFHRNLLGILGLHENQIGHYVPLYVKLLYSVSIILGGFYIVPKAISAIKRIRADMNVLMMIAVIGAVIINQWFEAAMVTFLFSVSVLLEHWSVERARNAVGALLDLSPPRATLLDESGNEIEKPVEEVEVGDVLYIRPGEKVPLDAVIIEGASTVNQAPITGESIPVSKEVGEGVFAGTINLEGAIRCKVTKGATDTTLAKIIEMVQSGQAKRAVSQKWVDRFASVYTPIMLCFALFVFIVPPLFFGESWADWAYRALVILVIACPCALVISTPVSIVSGLASAARNGVLIKGGVHLETPSRIVAVALDKTGTITYGKPVVQRIIAFDNHTEQEVLERAVALEKPSEHPLARAILDLGKENNITVEPVKDFKSFLGKGAQATLKGRRYWIGSHRFMHEMNQETPEIHQKALELEDAGHSVIALGTDDHVCGLISVADSPREFVKETLAATRAGHVKKIVMLTGDNTPTARSLAKEVGIDEYYAELLPEDKVAEILKLKKVYKEVAIVGDGINDAPAMAVASLSIAMGAMGTDAAIEAADIALMSDDLTKLPWLIRHSRRVMRIIKQNIAFSLSLKAIFIILGLVGWATLWMAIAVDTGASLVVVLNGIRLVRPTRFSLDVNESR